MKIKKNPELIVGDRIVLYHMDDALAPVDPGTEGTVLDIIDDPTEAGNKIITVKWDDGRALAILSNYDVWLHAKKKKLDESPEEWFLQNKDIIKYFDYKAIRKFLMNVRESGIMNMFAASPILYAGREHIDRHYGENPHDEDAFQEVLDMADEIKHMMIRGTMKYLEANNKEVTIENVNRHIRKMAEKMWGFYANFI